MEHAGQLVEMTAAIHEMDSLFHSLEHDVAGWRRLHRIQIGQGDLRTKMEMLEEMMHHLMHDAGVRSQFLIDDGAAPAAPVSTGAPAATVVPQTQVVPQFQRVEQQVVPQPQRLPSPTSQLPFLPGQG
jgi:hypothetical protein